MALVTWDRSYSVKVARCDNDHKKLFTLINIFHDAMAQGKGADVVQQTVQELLDYTRVHFSAEEGLMQKAGYAGLAAHRAQHQEFVRQVEQFQSDLQASKTGLSKGLAE